MKTKEPSWLKVEDTSSRDEAPIDDELIEKVVEAKEIGWAL